MTPNFYALARSSFALSTVNDALTLIGASGRRLYVVEISLAGLGTVSAANEIGVFRSTAGTTGSAAVTVEEVITDTPAQGFTNFTAWSVQPTLTGSGILRLGVNANGGVYRWVARPGTELELKSTEQLSIRGITGSSNLSMHVIVAEK